MQERAGQAGGTPETSPDMGIEGRAEIVDRLYEVALDPIRLGDLMEVWEGHLARFRTGPVAEARPLEDAEIEAHLGRATVFLNRFEVTRGASAGNHSVLDEIPRSAAFLADGGPNVLACNRPATVAFGLVGGAPMASLPFEAEDIDLLRSVARQVASGRAERVVTIRVRSRVTGSPTIIRVGAVDNGGGDTLALCMSTELVWPEGFEGTVQEAFGLTAAEVEIVRGISLGLPVKDIAEARGRSAETVRTQLRSILAKTETHSQSELVRVVLGLMDVSVMPSETSAAPLAAQPAPGARPYVGTLEPQSFQHMMLPDGRRLEWIEFGQPSGAPLLFMHLDYGFIRWPATAERAARTRGLRVIVPVRAGYGRSDHLPKGTDHLEGITADYAAVLDYLEVRRVAVLPMGADLRFAMNLAVHRPELVTGILGCACQLPLTHAHQYDRMDKWQRFILANARYAPKLLPFLVQAGFSLARRLGKEKFFELVNGGSPADMETFARHEVREALLAGSEVSLGARVLAHEAFTRECLGSEKGWAHVVRACRVPVRLLQGDQDPQAPAETIRELLADYPNLDVSYVPGTGQLLFFSEWPRALDEVERFLPRR